MSNGRGRSTGSVSQVRQPGGVRAWIRSRAFGGRICTTPRQCATTGGSAPSGLPDEREDHVDVTGGQDRPPELPATRGEPALELPELGVGEVVERRQGPEPGALGVRVRPVADDRDVPAVNVVLLD